MTPEEGAYAGWQKRLCGRERDGVKTLTIYGLWDIIREMYCPPAGSSGF